MDARTCKRIAEKFKLELYYDTQWKLWGLIDPTCMSQEESAWIAPATLKRMQKRDYEALCRSEAEKHGILKPLNS